MSIVKKKYPIEHILRWYQGVQCYPKCPIKKVKRHAKETDKKITSEKENKKLTHKQFVRLIRGELGICNLSASEYKRNVCQEPLVSRKSEKEPLNVAEAMTLTLLWLNRFEEKIHEETICYPWKGFDFKVLNSLLAKELITFSYKSKRVTFRDRGKKLAPKVAKEVINRLKKKK